MLEDLRLVAARWRDRAQKLDALAAWARPNSPQRAGYGAAVTILRSCADEIDPPCSPPSSSPPPSR